MSNVGLLGLIGVVSFALTAGGCVQRPPPLYQWDGYQRQLYEHFKADGSTVQEQLRVLEAQIQRAEGSGGALPPGFRGHLAVIYLRLGRFDEAKLQLESEKARFPESAPFMDFLLTRMAAPKS
jgi:hypothetical protein